MLLKAVKYPLVVVCAGAGYGKSSAVHDFAEEYKAATAWIQLSEHDNVGACFWENYVQTMTPLNAPLAKAINELGFPDTQDKLKQYQIILHKYLLSQRRLIVLDDLHYIDDPAVIRFLEEYVISKQPPGTTFFLISRSTPRINTAGLISKGRLFNISEDDLRFTDNELAEYFHELGISPHPDSIREIMQDTEGWAFAINLIARSYQKAPGYDGYVRKAMKTDIFRLMEAEIWEEISKGLQEFLISLSLIDHLSVDLITLLASGNKDLIAELEKQNAYVRRDAYINAYLIHPLFLEFLAEKQGTLSEEQKRETYKITGDWCGKNGFNIDALSYFEKIRDYESIVSLLLNLPFQIPSDIARYAAAVFDRAPEESFDTVRSLAITHIRCNLCQGIWDKSIELAKRYEAKFLQLPENDVFRKLSLGGIYYWWAMASTQMCLTDDHYDFDRYFEKYIQCISNLAEPPKLPIHATGPWIIFVGSSRKGAPEECIAALSRTVACLSQHLNGRMIGEDELAWGELKFYQGDTRAAERFIVHSLELAQEKKQFEIVHRALFYILRIAVSQGNYIMAEQALKDMKAQLEEHEYTNRFINYDISLSWYYCILGFPDKTPSGLKEYFSPYGHAGFIENFGNLMKARFFYKTKNYIPILSYIQQMRQRESYLFGRVEMLAMEACIHYKTKDKDKAFAVLLEAFNTASPNGILMPFLELGKDMRTLTSAALKEGGQIPKSWLEEISRKSALYAKYQGYFLAEYKKANGIEDNIYFTPRELETITDLCKGLSRTEIAAQHNISINTVKMVIGNIYSKLGAKNIADLIRIATERKLL
ncbi:MAG: LuxR C-terminal-related transcriptional regulator [Treponema sp.]|nr:LuxR C-terminal-related transcriptional regulator [Treponema sp.]